MTLDDLHLGTPSQIICFNEFLSENKLTSTKLNANYFCKYEYILFRCSCLQIQNQKTTNTTGEKFGHLYSNVSLVRNNSFLTFPVIFLLLVLVCFPICRTFFPYLHNFSDTTIFLSFSACLRSPHGLSALFISRDYEGHCKVFIFSFL